MVARVPHPPLPPVSADMWEALRVPDEWLPRQAPGGHRLTVGVRPLEVGTWLAPRPADEHLIAWKRQLLGSALAAEAVAQVPHDAADDLSARAARLVAEAVAAHRAGTPHVLRELLETGRDGHRPGPHPEDGLRSLAGAAFRVVDDLCVLQLTDTGPVLVAGALAMPNRWALADKLGRPLLEVHDPVPGYRETIGAATDRVLAGLPPGRVVARTNWGVSDRPDLYQPSPSASPRAEHAPGSRPGDRTTAASFGKGLLGQRWLRVEYQTLVALPGADGVLFTIRTAQERLDLLAERRPHAAGVLAPLIEELPAPMARYKGVDGCQRDLAAALRTAGDRQVGDRQVGDKQGA